MKRIHKITHEKQAILVICLVTVAMLLAVQVALDRYFYDRSTRPADEAVLPSLIISAVEGLAKPAPVDAPTGKIYISDAKLVLPVITYGSEVSDIRYAYFAQQNPKELQVTTSSIMRAAEAKLWTAQSVGESQDDQSRAMFAQVPNLQACTRGVHVFFGAQNQSGLTTAGNTQLKDGRTLYFYTEDGCNQNLSSLVAYLKQAQSY